MKQQLWRQAKLYESKQSKMISLTDIKNMINNSSQAPESSGQSSVQNQRREEKQINLSKQNKTQVEQNSKYTNVRRNQAISQEHSPIDVGFESSKISQTINEYELYKYTSNKNIKYDYSKIKQQLNLDPDCTNYQVELELKKYKKPNFISDSMQLNNTKQLKNQYQQQFIKKSQKSPNNDDKQGNSEYVDSNTYIQQQKYKIIKDLQQLSKQQIVLQYNQYLNDANAAESKINIVKRLSKRNSFINKYKKIQTNDSYSDDQINLNEICLGTASRVQGGCTSNSDQLDL